MRYVEAPARRAWILSSLRTAGFLSITEVASDLGVSDMTVRRDLRQLERTGEVRTVRGGVSLRHGTLRTSDFLNRAGTQSRAKRAMALAAAQLVREADTIAVDSGTSNYEVAAALSDDFTGVVVTASVPVIQLMLGRPKTRLISLGGELVPASQAFTGPITVAAAAGLHVRVLFLGCVAVDERGVYVHTDVEHPVKQALMSIADQVVLLADAEKFSSSASVQLCPLSQLTSVVTNRTPTRPLSRAFKNAGVKVVVAEETGLSDSHEEVQH